MPVPDIRKKAPEATLRVTLKLDTEVLAWFRKTGRGYQQRINEVLKWYIAEVEKQNGDASADPQQSGSENASTS